MQVNLSNVLNNLIPPRCDKKIFENIWGQVVFGEEVFPYNNNIIIF
jgi:hypothetical protein